MFLNKKKGFTWRTHPPVLPSFYHLVSGTSLFSIFSLNTVKEIFKNLPSKLDFRDYRIGDIYALMKGSKISCRSSCEFHENRSSERQAWL